MKVAADAFGKLFGEQIQRGMFKLQLDRYSQALLIAFKRTEVIFSLSAKGDSFFSACSDSILSKLTSG